MISSTTEELNSFRDKLVTTKHDSKRVVIDRQFAKDCPDIFNLLRGYKISILNEKLPVHEIADEIYSASYFISSHLTTSVYSIFLSEKGTLIERRILDAGCIESAKQLAEKVQCGYHEIGHEDICNVADFPDYFGMPLMYPVNVDYVNEVTQYIVGN